MRIRTAVCPVLALVILLHLGCGEDGIKEEAPKGFYVEQYQLLVPALHGFEKAAPNRQDAREIILLRRGDAWLWLSRLDGIVVNRDIKMVLSMIWRFAQERIYNVSYLKGTRLYALEIEKIDNPTRPYVKQLLIAQRTSDLYKRMNPIDRELQSAMIERFPVDKKLLVANYYVPVEEDVYIMTFIAPPEEFFFWEGDAKTILFELQFNVPSRPPGY